MLDDIFSSNHYAHVDGQVLQPTYEGLVGVHEV